MTAQHGLFAILLAVGCAATGPVHAQAEPLKTPFEVTAEISALTDYVARGISQTAGDPAGQAWVEAAYLGEGLRPKFYAGLWASTINLPESDVEADAYLGARGMLAGMQYNVVVVRYLYPDTDRRFRYQFTEFGGSFAYPVLFAVAQVGTMYSPDHWSASGRSYFSYANLRAPFAVAGHEWAARVQISRRLIEHNDRFGVPDYKSWSLRLDTSYLGLDFALFYTDTDVGVSQCPSDRCGARVVFKMSKHF